MGFLIIVFYVFGLLFGLYLGKTLGYDKFYDDVYLKFCSHIQDKLDEVEVRLQDGDYASQNDRLMDLGRVDAYQDMIEYMDNEILIEKK